MPELPDIDALESTFGSTWDAIRADVLSHIYLIFVFYHSVDITFSYSKLPKLDPAKLTQTPLYGILKDAGLFLLVPIVFLICILIYRGLLRWIAKILVDIQSIVFHPRRLLDPFPRSGKVNAALAIVAFTLYDPDFSISDLYRQLAILTAKYRIKKSADYTAFWKSIPTRNAYIYVGNASVFLCGWFVAYAFGGKPTGCIIWVTENFWTGTILLTAFWVWSWVRWRRLIIAVPAMELVLLAQFVSNDDEFRGFQEWMKVSLGQTVTRIRQLREEQTKERTPKPALIPKIRSAVGLNGSKKQEKPKERGRPAPKLYELGARFAWEEESRGTGLKWFKGYACFLYHQVHVALRVRAGGLWTRFLISIFGPRPPE